MEELYKIEEVADMLKVSIPKVRLLLKSGKLGYINISGNTLRKTYRITKSQVEQFKTSMLNG